AVLREEDPFLKAKDLTARLFSSRPLTVGVERFYAIKANLAGLGQADSTSTGPAHSTSAGQADLTSYSPTNGPLCDLPVDGERGRLVQGMIAKCSRQAGCGNHSPRQPMLAWGICWFERPAGIGDPH